jgi:23S rRNA (uracil1939-C5)-methyltransferase
MPVEVGTEIAVDIEKPAVGGRMIARHDGQIALVQGAIPGERVRVRIERSAKSLLHAVTTEVLVASADRRDPGPDWRCGGHAFAHIAYERQLRLKAEIICDSLGRIGRVPLGSLPDVMPSPERGYRMRARLHARDGRLGFYREGTHHVCHAAQTGQLSPGTTDWIDAVERVVVDRGLAGLVSIEIAENVPADQRACHLELQGGVEAGPFAALAAAGPLTGLSASRADRRSIESLAGVASVSDQLYLDGAEGVSLTLRRSARSFFQSNRFLLEPLMRHVGSLVPPGSVVDLYAGVGLFGLSLAAAGASDISLVEGDPVAGADLLANAEPYASRVRVERCGVESYLQAARRVGAFIVDPPRTGLSKAALAGVVRWAPARIIYVSCDMATLARDTRAILDRGYELERITGIDLFPNTAHVEAVAVFAQATPLRPD